MERHEFLAEMAATAIATQSENDEFTNEIYWSKFQYWDLTDFQQAIRSCQDELNRFPTVGQIRDRRPKTFVQATDVIKRISVSSMVAVDEADLATDADVESKIDALTDEDLENLFLPLWANSRTLEATDKQLKAAQFSVSRFRANEKSSVYRGFVRDALVRGESWVRRV